MDKETENKESVPQVVEEEEDNLYGLFVCEDYVAKEFVFDSESQQLLCSNMSSTDFDLTGQIVWPASLLLGWFVFSHRNDIFRNKRVLELGAGCGLAGFFAAKFANSSPNSVFITDGNDIVMKLLKKNHDFLQCSEQVQVKKLLWGKISDLQILYPTPEQLPEVIIGADIILWPSQIQSLLSTIHYILYKRYSSGLSAGEVYISYVVRANSTTDLLFRKASEWNLLLDTIGTESFVPSDCHVFDTLEKRLFTVKLDEAATFLRVEEIEAIYSRSEQLVEEQLGHETMPC